ncbi:MAG: LPS assembly lipoprotein LptE [Fibrobacterales bacterium]
MKITPLHSLTTRAVYGSFLLLLVVTLLGGCYSFSNSTLPSSIKTITIFPTENQTMQAVLGDKLTERVKQMFTSNAREVRQVSSSPHSEFYITLKKYENEPLNFSADATIESYQVRIIVDVLFKDLTSDEILYEGSDIEGIGIYKTADEDEISHGQQRALEDIEQIIINNSLSAW